MAKTQTILDVFVASPGDVIEERKILEEVINEFNVTWSDERNLRLDLVKWETHSRPGFGEDAQDVVNQQIGDEYDIFLGLMWGRYGSQTKRAESGTEEEFERAYRRLSNLAKFRRSNKGSHLIMVDCITHSRRLRNSKPRSAFT